MKCCSTILSYLFVCGLSLVSFETFGDTVFSDSFGSGSTIQSASPGNPTANSTDYEIFQGGAAPSGGTINPGALHFQTRSTASEFAELQAMFSATPIALSTVGDWIDLSITFVNSSNVMLSGANANSSLNLGLYNSGGIKPVQGRQFSNGGITGGSQSWRGYIGRTFLSSSSSGVLTRLAQGTNTSPSSQHLDLLFSGASGSASFNNPSGTAVGANGTSAVTLTAGSTYTLELRITASGTDGFGNINSLSISNAVYDSLGTHLFDIISSASGSTYLTNSFDALAFGWRHNAASEGSGVDINSILVGTFIQSVPEPSIIALAGIGMVGVLLARRRR